ncbi:stalk domain-containing protein [Paenibacillus chartarius]|uniref:Stalk domain-containing protein n=1 Tax=Paenibacillus chartarius TaxID=747481 RepID=A0ABV6DKN7_9BACL
MKRNKWLLTLGMTAAFSAVFTAGAYADDVLEQVQAYLRPDFQIIVDGATVVFEEPPLIYNDKTYLPLKDLGQSLGAQVIWKGETKSIYVNSRLIPQQQEEEEQAYEQVAMSWPTANYVDYLGGTYILLQFRGAKEALYRESDLIAMGVDVGGLRKVQDKYTKWVFVPQSEVDKRLKQKFTVNYTIQTNYSSGPVDEKDPKKLKAIQAFMKDWSTSPTNNPPVYTQFIVADKTDEPDTYRLLGMENGHLYYYFVNLKILDKNNPDAEYIRDYKKEDIQAGYPDENPYNTYGR